VPLTFSACALAKTRLSRFRAIIKLILSFIRCAFAEEKKTAMIDLVASVSVANFDNSTKNVLGKIVNLGVLLKGLQ